MSEEDRPRSPWRALLRIINGPVTGPFLLALVVAGLGYWLILGR